MVEWDAGDYHNQSNLQEAMAAEQLARLTLAGNERVLDLGCGDGKITAQIALRVPRGTVVGVDPSRNMIEFATTHFAAKQPNLRFAVADARALGFNQEFDLIVSFNALHWVPEQDAALQSIARALVPKGRAQLRFVGKGARKSLEDVIEDTCHSGKWTGYFKDHKKPYAHFTPEEYRAMVARNGLRVQSIELHDKAWDFKTREAFQAFCRATFVEWTRFLPEAERSAFITEVLDAYAGFAPTNAAELNTFKFYQMEIVLEPR